jgi:hypothetical protein
MEVKLLWKEQEMRDFVDKGLVKCVYERPKNEWMYGVSFWFIVLHCQYFRLCNVEG